MRNPDLTNDEAVINKPLALATLGELEAHIELLGSQIATDRRSHDALRELRDMALAAGATGTSCVMDVISAIQPELAEVA